MPSDIFDEIEATPETTTDIFDQIAPSPELLKERPAFEEPLESPEITAKRAGLTSEMQQARIAGKLGRAELAARKGVETGAQILSGIFPTTAISRAAQAIGLRPIVPPEHVKQVREGVTAAIDTVIPRAQVPEDAPRVIPPELGEKINKGLTEFGDETLSSFTSPEQVALLASGAPAPQVVGRLFQIGSITSVPEAIEGLKEAVKTGDAKQITKAGAGLGMTLAIPAAIEKGLAPKPAPLVPPVTGRVLRPPAERGVVTAIGPEILPPPGVEVPPLTPPPAPTPTPRAIPSLPAVEPGFVRVFSGTRFPGSKSSWFSTNVKRAGEFAGDRGEVNYVDVPKEEFDAAAERAKEGGSFTPGDALLSNKWVNQAKSLREELIKRARPQAKPTTAADLEPALLVNDVPVAGGWDHEAIFKSKNTPDLPVEEKMSLVEAYANDKQHIFVNKNTGERYTREQAAKILGEKDPLDSARLRELQGIPKPEAKAKAPPAPPAPTPSATAAKEPWQMTRAEFIKAGPEGYSNVGNYGWSKTGGDHGPAVADALAEGKPVPPEVLRDYPDLAPKPAAPAAETVPIGQGPGGMTRRVSARPEPPPETLEATGLKHAIDELERVSYGFAARTLPEKQAMAAAWQRAGATLAQDADAGRRLTQALVLNPKRGLSADESALILRHKVGLENAVNDAAERTLTTTGDAKVEANAQLDRSRAELNDLLDAVAARGTEWGREGRWRQALAYEDYSFATQERLLSAAKGRPLTDAERVELQRQLADYKAKFDAFEKSQAEREQRAVDIAVKEALDKVEKETAAAPKYGPRVLQVAENFAKYMDAKGDAALQRLRERASRMSAGVDPAIVSDLAIWGASKATRGVVEFAKWSDMAISELGEWVRPHLEAAWESSKKFLDSELTVLEKKVGKPTTAAVKKKISERTAEENIADLSEKISTKLEENDLSAVAPLVRKLARFYVESGVRGRDNLINSVHAVLQDIVPGITRSDTMRAIAGYGDYKLLPKDAVSIILRGYKGEMQQIAKLEDMAAGIAPAKTGIERRTPTEEERTLIRQVEEAKKKGGYAVTDPETQLRTAMDAVKRRLENQITDLEKQISTREKIIKEPTRLEYDAEANQLKARRDELKKEFDEIFPKQPMTEVERLAKWKDRTQKRIAEIQEMIRSGDIEIKPPKPPVALDVEGRRLQAALAESKENLKHAREKAEWEKMSVFQKARRGAVDSYDAARMLMTTGEFSFVLRQGKWTFLSRPLTTIRALPGMFQAMRNWRTAHEVDLKIFNDPEYPAAKAAKLHLIDESASLTRQEEIYAGRWAHAIPVVAHFNRAARVFLNKIRFDTWKAMRKSVGRDGVTTPAEDLAIATFVNESTGRGGLGFAEQAAVPMGRAFFAPRYTISRFQLLVGHSLWKGSVRSRRVIATEYARALIGLGIYYSLLNAYFAGSKDKRRISLDPRSADFGKVRLGNTRLDPLAGVQQAAVFIGRTATGETVTQKGKTVSIRRAENVKPRYGDPTWTDIAARFARSKMHPVPGAIANLFSGTTMDGRATSFVKETGNLVGPITYFDIYSALNEQDIPDAMALSLLAVLGEGLQTYKPKK